MSEVAIREQGLTLWADEARRVAAIAESICKTSFVPDAFRNKPAEVTAAILAGQEVGLSPMASLRSISVIQGTPAMSALALRALVQSHGHEIWVEEATQTRAVICGKRQGAERVERSVWTIDRAQKMGLTGKQNWKTQPQNMLVARATSEVARLIAADVMLGMPYSVEELADLDDAVEQPKPKRRTAQRALPPPPAEPDLEAETIEATEVSEPELTEWPPVQQPPEASDA